MRKSSKQIRYLQIFQILSTVLRNLNQIQMSASLHNRRSFKNMKVIQKIQNTSLNYFKNYEKSLNSNSQFFVSKSAPLTQNSELKQQIVSISINGFTQDWQKYENYQNDAVQKIDSNQNKFYSIYMEQSTLLTYSNVTFNPDQNKQNDRTFSNLSPLSFSSHTNFVKQRSVRAQNMEKVLNKKLMDNCSRAIKNMKKLDQLQKQTILNQSSLSMKKINLIEKLINVLETNKIMRVKEMWDERKILSDIQQEQKKIYELKLKHIEHINEKVQKRQTDIPSAIHELNGIRG